jgi:hypothetical protein
MADIESIFSLEEIAQWDAENRAADALLYRAGRSVATPEPESKANNLLDLTDSEMARMIDERVSAKLQAYDASLVAAIEARTDQMIDMVGEILSEMTHDFAEGRRDK